MTKFDNYIFYSICLKTLGKEKVGFYSYRLFCESFKKYLMMESLSYTEKEIIQEIGDYLSLIYGLSDGEIGSYIGRYFLEDKFIDFEILVKMDKKFYPMSKAGY